MWYNIDKISDEKRKVEPTEKISNVQNRSFAEILDIAKKRKVVNIMPRGTNSVSDKLINQLCEKREIRIFAEIENGKISVSIEMQNGVVYRNVFVYYSFSSFERDFIMK